MPTLSRVSAPTVAGAMLAFCILPLSSDVQACGPGEQQAFTCTTNNNKVVEVCNAGKDATYSFGRAGTKPALFLKTPKTKLRYADSANPVAGQSGRAFEQTLQFLNANTSYTISLGGNSSSSASASVEVASGGRHLASVACRDGTVRNNLDVLGMDTHTQASATKSPAGKEPPRASNGIVFAKRAKPKVTGFTWNVHHPEGVEFDGPIRTSIGKLHDLEAHHPEYGTQMPNGFALDGTPIAGPHGKFATILYGSILDYGDRLAIIYSYWADGACMACGSEAVIVVGRGAQVIDQLNRPYGVSESDPNECLWPDAETFVDGVAVARADKTCAGPNRLMRVGYEGIEVSGG